MSVHSDPLLQGLVPLSEIAQRLEMHRDVLAKLANKDPHFPARVRVGKRTLVREDDVRRWLLRRFEMKAV